MHVCGVVTEYNPFHRGHLWQLEETRRRLGPDTAFICAMSGNYVQRGESALLPKHVRAAAAVQAEGGPDLVVELPTRYAVSTAEKFAYSAVSLLDACGVATFLSFGSETGDLCPLMLLSEEVDTERFSEAVSHFLDEGMTFAAARQAALHSLGVTQSALLGTPNNILGVEYLRALKRLGSSIKPMTVMRQGMAHDSGDFPAGSSDNFASASQIRKLISSGRFGEAFALLPEGTAETLKSALENRLGPPEETLFDAAVMSKLRRMRPEDYARLADISEGLEYRIAACVAESSSIGEAAEKIKTKRYTLARIRRLLLCAFLDVYDDQALPATPPYIRVLAFNDIGRNLLRTMREKAGLPIIIKPAGYTELPLAARRVFEEELRCTDLYQLTCPSRAYRSAGSDLRTSPVYLSKRV